MHFPYELQVAPVTGHDVPMYPCIPTHSAMFRRYTQLEQVLDIALTSQPEPLAEITVLSVGCSLGAEADSVLAYISSVAPDTHVNITGIDTNPQILSHARAGAYHTEDVPKVKGPAGTTHRLDVVAYLPMFEVTPLPPETQSYPLYHINTNRLRAQHKVNFIEADLANGDPVSVPPADVILCNNVLYHLTPEYAERLVWGMAARLAVGGVMSFGANSSQVTMENNLYGAADYRQWQREMGDTLASTGITPVLSAARRVRAPFVFRRDT